MRAQIISCVFLFYFCPFFFHTRLERETMEDPAKTKEEFFVQRLEETLSTVERLQKFLLPYKEHKLTLDEAQEEKLKEVVYYLEKTSEAAMKIVQKVLESEEQSEE